MTSIAKSWDCESLFEVGAGDADSFERVVVFVTGIMLLETCVLFVQSMVPFGNAIAARSVQFRLFAIVTEWSGHSDKGYEMGFGRG